MPDIHLAGPPGPPPRPPRRHLLAVADLTRGDVERILDTARALSRSLDRDVKKLPTLRGRTIVHLFYESSTRTLASFELAAKRLSADTMSLRSSGSSVDKGESLKDTAPTLIPREVEALGCDVSFDIDAIRDADVVYVLRMQRERMEEGAAFVPSLREYTARWGITPERVRTGQVVMHPGPMNRGVEIDQEVADSDAALVTEQVRSGLVVRMAVLYDLLTTGPVRAAVPLEVA